MQDSLWDSERLQNVGWIMSRYSDHVMNGDVIRRGIEGDPCNTYRGSEDVPHGTVTRVERNDDGFVRFWATMDDGEEMEFDNRNIAPNRVWEIHPDHIDSFRSRVLGESGRGGVVIDSEPEEIHRGDDEFRSSMETHVVTLDERLKRMENAESELERTIASAVRHLAGDLMRTYRGEQPEFALRYADRYDLALQQGGDEEYRGEREEKSEKKSHQEEKYTFGEVSPVGYRGELRESSILSE